MTFYYNKFGKLNYIYLICINIKDMTKQTIGAIIKESMKEQKISTSEMARRTGLTEMTIYNISNGKVYATLANLLKIQKVLKIEIIKLDKNIIL